MDQHEEWQDPELRELDLELENQALELDCKLRGGSIYKAEDDIDPQLQNVFLKHVEAYEEMDRMPKLPVRSLFPEDYEFPKASELKPDELEKKLDEILDILEIHNINVSLSEKLPTEMVYAYVVDSVIPSEEVWAENTVGFTIVFDGCNGGCEDCFQRQFCEVRDEVEDTSEEQE